MQAWKSSRFEVSVLKIRTPWLTSYFYHQLFIDSVVHKHAKNNLLVCNQWTWTWCAFYSTLLWVEECNVSEPFHIQHWVYHYGLILQSRQKDTVQAWISKTSERDRITRESSLVQQYPYRQKRCSFPEIQYLIHNLGIDVYDILHPSNEVGW